MSKAFTRESDDLPERPALKLPTAKLPPGVKNYLTPRGAQNFREELERLQSEEQTLTATATESNGKPGLAQVRQRIFEIQNVLESAVVTAPPPPPWDQVLFGATVTVRDQRGETSDYRIVGVDETDLDQDWISWLSPLAKALLKAKVGDQVRVRVPGGERNLEVIAIRSE